MIRAVIIDDEQHSVETLRWKLEKFCPDVNVVQAFLDPVEGLEYLRREAPDLLFIDIAMPQMTGFDVLQALGRPSFGVVFTTAYDDFGIQAIKFSALDYLLKPVQNEELRAAVDKFRQRSLAYFPERQLANLFENIKKEAQGQPCKIALATKERIEFVSPDEIVVCTSDSNYTMVHLSGGAKRLISRTLKEFEEMLTPYRFFRTHHSHLVNLAHIKEFVRADGGYLVMSNNMEIPVSRSRKDELLNLF
jgi:two-component system LytT family response regulator